MDLNCLTKYLGHPVGNIRMNNTDNINVPLDWTPEIIEFVNKLYIKDFVRLEYMMK